MIKDAKLNWVRLPVASLENCRELGGYDTGYGQQTRWHSFVRSSDMSKLTEEDASFLEAYGVRTVIDLRGQDEIAIYKNPLADATFCQYHNIPLVTGQISDITRSTANVFVGDFYVDLLERTDAVVKIFDVMANAEEGCIVFHCQGGKDRTGILAMLLLGLAGVDKRDIVSNYEVTYTYLETLRQYSNSAQYSHIPKEFLYSDPAYIMRAYEHIVHTYQSVDQYLLAKGVDAETAARVRSRLIGESAGRIAI